MDEDGLAPARGCFWGTIAAGVVWAVIFALLAVVVAVIARLT